MRSNGQAFLIELMAAILVFSLVVVYSNQQYREADHLFEKTFLKTVDGLDGKRGVETMLMSKGIPSDWNDQPINDLVSPGILNDNGQLDEGKMRVLIQWLNDPDQYESIRQKLSLSTNDVFVRLTQPKIQFVVPGTLTEDGQIDTCPGSSCLALDTEVGNEKAISKLGGAVVLNACGGRPKDPDDSTGCKWKADDANNTTILRRSFMFWSPWTKREEVRVLEVYLSAGIQ